MVWYFHSENFVAKQAFVDDYILQFIELLQGISWQAFIVAIQVAAPSILRLLRPIKYKTSFFWDANMIKSALFSFQFLVFPFIVNIETPFLIPSD